MTEEQSEGIVLQSIPYKDKERILKVFTKTGGLISLIVKGISIRNPHLLSLTMPFCLAEFHYQKKNSDLFRYVDGTIIDENFHLRVSYQSLKAAGELIYAISHSQLPGKPAPELYALLSSYLKQAAAFANPLILSASFYLKILKHEGLIAFINQSLIHDSSSIYFSQSEQQLIQELVACRTFNHLKTYQMSTELKDKICIFFKERIKN
ncbi:MAG: DNA repair protein RecO [Anaerolineae bacterium]